MEPVLVCTESDTVAIVVVLVAISPSCCVNVKFIELILDEFDWDVALLRRILALLLSTVSDKTLTVLSEAYSCSWTHVSVA